MKKSIIAILLAFAPGLVMAAGAGVHLDKAPVSLTDKASQQRGARLFANYCMGCHSTQYMRYVHVGRDLGLTDDQMSANLIFTRDENGEQTKVGELMKNAIRKKDAAKWFGAPPPDLTLVARLRGADWLYTFLRSFHQDTSRPFGVNNTVFPSVGMPHILWELEGVKTASGDMVVPGKLSTAEYDAAVGDLVNYLVYMGEPVQAERRQMGIWVLLFLAVFTVIAYLLKKEYWKDVH